MVMGRGMTTLIEGKALDQFQVAPDGASVRLGLRDADGRPVDALHIHGYAPREDSRIVQKAIWEQLSADHGTAMPDSLGGFANGTRSEALAIAQLLLVWHLLEAMD